MIKHPFFIRYIAGILIAVFISSCTNCNIKDTKEQPYGAALAYAEQHLAHTGTLIQQPNGYSYLKVDDDYIHKLYPLLQAKGFHKPPYFRTKNAPGAHISIIYEDEHVKLKEVGKKFSFTLKNITIVHVNKEVSYIVLKLDAPDLEKLRTSYGLKTKLKGHEFHITLAKRQLRQ